MRSSTEEKKPLAIGIDFGTTNTAASALMAPGKAELLPLDHAPGLDSPRELVEPLCKTLLYFPTRKEAFFGQGAIDQYFDRDREGRFFQSVKRLLPNSEFTGTTVHGQYVDLEELIARFLRETRARIERQVGSLDGVHVVMGRPARYSEDPGREGLAVVRFKRACELAGFERFELVEEPVAAASTYVASMTPGAPSERVLIADLGGGTSDFTLMEATPAEKPRVLAVHGVPVAGDAMDSAFMLAKLTRDFGAEIKYQRPFSSNVLTLPASFTRLLPKWHHHAFLREKSAWNFLLTLRNELVDPVQKPQLENLITLIEDNLGYSLHRAVEKLKIELSGGQSARFEFKSYPISIGFDVTRAEYEGLIDPVVQQIARCARETLEQARLDPEAVDAVFFTGGTSRIPAVRAAIQAAVPKARVMERDSFTSVAAGLTLASGVP